MSLTTVLRHRTELRLSPAQRLLAFSHTFGLRLALVGELREPYKPKGDCPSCGREMTPAEIIRGFNQDPRDFTTCCTKCGCRFPPRLILAGGSGIGRVEMAFYCAIQTLDQLRGKEHLLPKTIAKSSPAVYRSAIIHFGSLKSAFKKDGVDYPYEEEVNDWKNKIQPFLGRLPDTVIADCVDKPVGIIRKMRKDLGICRYTADKALAEIE